jgi:23S rRNA pseudouridine955/2504/2580 synthase
VSEIENRVVVPDEADIRLDRWFKRHFPLLSHGHLEKLLRTGQVRIDGKRAKANVRLEPGQTVRVPPLGDAADRPHTEAPRPAVSRRDAAELQARVLYRDADVLVIYCAAKPRGRLNRHRRAGRN